MKTEPFLVVLRRYFFIFVYVVFGCAFIYYFFPTMAAPELTVWNSIARDVKALVDGMYRPCFVSLSFFPRLLSSLCLTLLALTRKMLPQRRNVILSWFDWLGMMLEPTMSRRKPAARVEPCVLAMVNRLMVQMQGMLLLSFYSCHSYVL